MQNDVRNEVRAKIVSFKAELPDISSVERFLDEELQSFSQQFSRAQRALTELYNDDTFYVMTIHSWLSDVTSSVACVTFILFLWVLQVPVMKYCMHRLFIFIFLGANFHNILLAL